MESPSPRTSAALRESSDINDDMTLDDSGSIDNFCQTEDELLRVADIESPSPRTNAALRESLDTSDDDMTLGDSGPIVTFCPTEDGLLLVADDESDTRPIFQHNKSKFNSWATSHAWVMTMSSRTLLGTHRSSGTSPKQRKRKDLPRTSKLSCLCM